jgi:hypothetical protein
MLLGRWAWLALLASGCFTPSFSDGYVCGPQGQCPPGQRCGPGGRCSYDPPLVDGGASDGGRDAMPLDGACADDPEPPGDECPPACTGGCVEDVCVIACGAAGCDNTTLTCPPDFACEIECNGIDACDGATVNCPQDYLCALTCNGTDACGNLGLICGGGSCSVHCGPDRPCTGAVVTCGAGPCSATCDGATEPTLTDCAAACSCSTCPPRT